MLRPAHDDPPVRRHALRPEARLLLACARARMDPRVEQRAVAALREPIDWPMLLALATRHRVLPLIARHLPMLAGDLCPASVLADLKRRAFASACHALMLARELIDLIRMFDAAGIPAVPFKGPVLAQRAYGDLALRTSADIDLLVPRASIGRARSMLIDRGYIPGFPTASPREAAYLRSLAGEPERDYLDAHGEHHMVSADGRINIDLHWSVALDALALRLDPEQFWRRLETCPFSGITVRQLGPEDTLLVLCINGAKERWRQLQRVCDVAEWVRAHPRIEWDTLESRAAQAGVRRMLHLGLLLASDLLGAPVPMTVVRTARRDPVIRSVSSTIRRDLPRLDIDPTDERTTVRSCLFHLRLRDDALDRARYALAQLKPTVGDWALAPLPRGWSFLHFIIRPIRLIASAV